MAYPIKAIPYITNSGHTLTPLENAFISAYILHKNATQAVIEAGYKCNKSQAAQKTKTNGGRMKW